MPNKNAMMGHTILAPVNQPKQCCICMDETKIIVPHPCKICSENSWTVCKDCSQKLDKCPICREIIQNDNINSIQSNNDEIYSTTNQCLLWSLAILQFMIYYICLVYIGKLYYYIICSIHCNTFSLKKIQEYKCYHVSDPNFLTNYSKIVSETVIGIIISATLFGIYKGIRLCWRKCKNPEPIVNNSIIERPVEIEEV